MVVKSKVVSKHVGDLTNIFGILTKHKLRLNASKCLFRVGSGKFLGYMVNWKHKIQECKNIWARLDVYKQNLNSFTYRISQKWKYPCRLFGHPCHFLGTRFATSNTCWRLVRPNPNQEGLTPDSSNQVRVELDGSYIDVPWKGCIARGEIRGWESTKKSSLVLDVRRQKVV